MTALPRSTRRRLGLVIDLDTCVGCHACVVHCKEWNTGGYPAPLSDADPYGADPSGTWLNRVHSYEVEAPGRTPRVVHFPKSCLHCEDAPCVTVCPTGASYKREEDGIVLVDEDLCIGCKLCAWACPYGAREFDGATGVMKKCTLCIDRIYNDHLADPAPACVSTCPARARHFGDLADPGSEVSRLVAERGGYELMPETGCRPTNRYLPPRTREPAPIEGEAGPRGGGGEGQGSAPALADAPAEGGFLGWIDRLLSSGAPEPPRGGPSERPEGR